MKTLSIFLSLFFVVNYSFSQEQLTNLPTLYLTTEGGKPITSKETYINGNIKIKSSVLSEELDMPIEIRGRGNSTWQNYPKKPYRIKLESKQKLLGMPSNARSWVLLANYADKSLIRNALAFKISELVEMEFSPAFRFVDVVLNGEYQGNYMLTDQVEVRKHRVPVEEQEPEITELSDISGGYLLEIDGMAAMEPISFRTPQGMRIVVKYPKYEEIKEEQINYIADFTIRFEELLFSADFSNSEGGFRTMVDEHSLVNWYIACELTGNSDSFWSTFLYKYKNEDKLYFGPLWDFDIAFNNDKRLGNAEWKLMRLYAHSNPTWIRQIWEADWFKKAVYNRWMELVEEGNIRNKLLNFIEELHTDIDDSQELNYEKWPTLGKFVAREYFIFSTYEEEIDYLKNYVDKRIDYLTEYFSFLSSEPSKPFIAENYYYVIANRATDNYIKISGDSEKENARLLLWDYIEDNHSYQWKMVHLDNSKYQLINRKSRLAAKGAAKGENIIQVLPDKDDESQQWNIVPVLTGNIYGIENEASKYYMNNKDGNSKDGTAVTGYDDLLKNSENQQWYIRKVEVIGNNPTAINNIKINKKNIFVYPNPASSEDVLYIQFPAKESQENVLIELFNLNGNCCYSQTHFNSDTILELPINSMNVGKGLYILKIRTSSDFLVQKLLVK